MLVGILLRFESRVPDRAPAASISRALFIRLATVFFRILLFPLATLTFPAETSVIDGICPAERNLATRFSKFIVNFSNPHSFLVSALTISCAGFENEKQKKNNYGRSLD